MAEGSATGLAPVPPAHSEAEIQRSVGARIRELRLSLSMKSVELARQAGISQSQLSKIETGKATLSIKVLSRLCEVLNRPLYYLFQNEENVPRVLGTLSTVEGPERLAFSWFAEELERRTEGRISLIPLSASQLGSGTDQVQRLAEGVIDMFIEDLSHYSPLAPPLGFLAVPYSFASFEHLRAFLTSRHFDEAVRRPLLDHNIRLLNTRWSWRRGIELALVGRETVIQPRDVRGRRVRVPDSGPAAAFWARLGATPVVMPWHEVGQALAREQIDLLPTHKTHITPLGLCRHARYVTLLGDISMAIGVAVNEAKFQALPPTVQDAVVGTSMEAGERFTSRVIEAEKDNEVRNIAENDAVYLKVNLKPWQAAAAKAREDLVGRGILDRATLAAIEACRPAAS
ncbi:TRAP transporter substrate-binding protein DctP [Tistlia consotensis]|nr:TRAP transporter substrate-binding protein DctP [Tistlia consotensis]